MVVVRKVLFRQIADRLALKRLNERHPQIEDQISIQIRLTGNRDLGRALGALQSQLAFALPLVQVLMLAVDKRAPNGLWGAPPLNGLI